MRGRGLLLLFTVATAWGAGREVVVAADGGGQFRTVQAALDSVPQSWRSRKRTRIEWEA